MEGEQRGDARRRVVRRGVIVHERSGAAFRCTIVDISIGGAQLQLIAPDLPAEALTLIDPVEGRSHTLKIVWRRGAFAGVAFRSSADLPR